MTPEAQRIAIAEACGRVCGDSCSFIQVGPDEQEHRSDCECNGTGWIIPDYLNDLNAMHEAEKVLTDVQKGQYRMELENRHGHQHYGPCGLLYWWEQIRSTAAHRCEAFLRTIGKWTDD